MFLKRLILPLMVVLLSFSTTAFACGDCEDQVCVPLVGCACVYNAGRCAPIVIPKPERFPFCNITNDNPGGKPSCTNCSSNFSGDAGKTDCLARHQGNYAQSGACVPGECRNNLGLVSAANVGPFVGFKKIQGNNSVAPEMAHASKVQILELTTSDGAAAKASAAITKSDGTQLRCSYDLTYQPSKSKAHTGIQFVTKTEACATQK